MSILCVVVAVIVARLRKCSVNSKRLPCIERIYLGLYVCERIFWLKGFFGSSLVMVLAFKKFIAITLRAHSGSKPKQIQFTLPQELGHLPFWSGA